MSNDVLRVVQLIPDLGVGGAERMLLNLVGALDRERVETTVVSLYERSGTAIEVDLEGQGVPVLYLGKRIGFDLRTIKAVKSVIRRLAPHVVHTHRSALAYLVPTLLFNRLPVVHTLHNVAKHEVPFVHRWAHSAAFRLGAAPVAIGAEVDASFRRVYGRGTHATIPIGIPLSRFARAHASRQAWRQREAIPIDAFVLTCVARFAPQKNILTLLEAFATFAVEVPNALLVLVGDGPARSDIENAVASKGLGGRVRILLQRRDVPEVLGASDVFVLSSDWEGTPVSIMEAMAAGLPVVATAVGGVPDLIAEGVTGRLAPPRDPRALATKMLEMALDRQARERMGRACARYAHDSLDVAAMARRYETLYRELLKSGSRPLAC